MSKLDEDGPAGGAEGRSERSWLDWLPLGLLCATGLWVGRRLGALAADRRALPGASEHERELLGWQTWQGALAEALPAVILGLIGASLIQQASRAEADGSEAGSRWPSFVFGALCLLAGLSGWPIAPPALRAQPLGVAAADDLATVAGLAFGGALLVLIAARARRSAFGPLVSGPAGLALALAVGGAGAFVTLRDALAPPRFERREVVLDLVATNGPFEVLEAAEGAAPRLGVLSPDVMDKTDSADKPALLMPPGARVAFRVEPPAGVAAPDEPLVLRAAAGLDGPLRGWMLRNGVERCAVEFLVRRNGEVVFETRIPSVPNWDYASHPPGAFVWHHAGGEQGLAVTPGDRIELETRIPEGDPAEDIPRDVLTAGFGGLTVERRVETERLVARPEAPNVVLIVMDTLRADRLSCYGHSRPTTPHLDALAERGVVFDNAYSTASWTWPATASLLTGLAPEAHGVVSAKSCTLALGWTTVAEALQARGFTTAAFSCNPLIAPERYFDQGFETFWPAGSEFRMSDEVMPDILRWLRGHHRARFFLYLHLADPHIPHRPHPDEVERLGLERPDDFPDDRHPLGGMSYYTGELMKAAKERGATTDELRALVPPAHRRWISDQYDASVATGDRWLGVFFDELVRLGLDENTIIAFTSDHGEELFDHDLLEHGHTLHSELVHVPLILAGPGLPRGLREEAPVSNRHLAPTLARLGGAALELPPSERFEFLLEADFEGRAQYQTTKGLWPAAGGRVLSNQVLHGVREGEWVLHWREDAELGVDDAALYNVLADPRESRDLAAGEKKLSAEMYHRLAEALGAQRAVAPAQRIGAGASGEATLVGVGYVDGGEEAEDGAATDARRQPPTGGGR